MSIQSFGIRRRVASLLGEGSRFFRRGILPGHRIVNFHAIDTEVDGDTYKIYSVSESSFKLYASLINDLSNFDPVLAITDVQTALDRGTSITFDDGYLSTLTVAGPILCRMSLPFSVFLAPDLITSGDSRYMNRDHVKELSQLSGVHIGAHGFNHVRLSSIPVKARATELRRSREWIEDLIQRPVTTMSYPYGDMPEGIREDVKAAGFTLAASSLWGFNSSLTDRFTLRRIDFWNGDSERVARTKLLGHWNWLPIGRN